MPHSDYPERRQKWNNNQQVCIAPNTYKITQLVKQLKLLAGYQKAHQDFQLSWDAMFQMQQEPMQLVQQPTATQRQV
jgi:hypothetical protein